MTCMLSPRKLHLSFGLRALLALVALSAVPLAFFSRETTIIHQRRVMRERIETAGGFFVTDGGDTLLELTEKYNIDRNFPQIAPEPEPTLIWYRRLLGDFVAKEVVCRGAYSQEEMDRIQSIFPEAYVWRNRW